MSYDKQFTDALQFAWGSGFLSPGGTEEVRNLLRGHSLRGKTVLDIGSGLGGVDLLLISEHGANHVTGIDVDPWLIEQSWMLAREAGLADSLDFRLVVPGPLPFGDAAFDVVFSKDAMIHIPDKEAFYQEVLRVLKPRGQFVAGDWLFAPGAGTSAAIEAWLHDNPLNFMFTTIAEAKEALARAGFVDAYVIDRRIVLQSLNRREIALLEGPGLHQLSAIIGEDMAKDRLASARGRQGALDTGDLIPSHLGGVKP